MKLLIAATLILPVLLPERSRADVILLGGNSKISGSVSEITPEGGVKVDSPVAAEPLMLKPGVVERIHFTGQESAVPTGDTRLKLVNGDTFLCDLKSLDKDSLTVGTFFAGDLKVPRSTLSSLELGVREPKRLFGNENGLQGWTNERWRAAPSGGLSINGTGRISRAFEVPDQFILRFTLLCRGTPDLMVTFADPLEPPSPGQSSRYLLHINSNGVDLSRLGGENTGAVRIAQTNRNTTYNLPKGLNVEIRVDRKRSEVWLYLNGVLEGRSADLKDVPKGGGVSFTSNADDSTTQSITNFGLYEWDAQGERHRTEERGDTGSDALIDSQGDRYSGELQGVTTQGGVLTLSFKSPLLETPMTIPARRVSTVFFKANPPPDKDPPPPAAGRYVLRLHDGGILKVESGGFSGERMHAEHAKLGPLEIKRAAVTIWEKVQAGTPNSRTE